MTRLGDLLYFGQLFKAFGNNYFAQIAHILGKLSKIVKIFHFSNEIIFGQLLLVDIWRLFTGHTHAVHSPGNGGHWRATVPTHAHTKCFLHFCFSLGCFLILAQADYVFFNRSLPFKAGKSCRFAFATFIYIFVSLEVWSWPVCSSS